MPAPTDISGLLHRFRTSQVTGYANGASVSSAPFETGGLTLTQATVANQPTYISASVNGLAGLRFNGTTTFVSSGLFGTALAQPYTLSIVVKLAAATGRQVIVDGSSSFVLLNDSTSSSYGFYAGSSVYGGTPNTSAHVITVTSTSTSSSLYVDGTLVGSGNAGTGSLQRYILGAQSNNTGFFTGDICEINTYSKALSSAELSTLDSYVQNTYGITVSDYSAASTTSTSRFIRNVDLTSLVIAATGFQTTNVQTASYTLVRTDVGRAVEMNVATVNSVTIPPNASVAIPVGAYIDVCQVGIGQTYIVAGAGVTLDISQGSAVYSRFGTIRLRQRAMNEWVIAGSVTPFVDPTTINGLVYRLRASTIGVTTDGSAVSSAPLEVGGLTLVQGTAASQPIWRARGKNGKPYLSFDGVNDFLYQNSGVPTYNQPVTVCVVGQFYNGVDSQEVVKLGGIEILLNQAANTWATYAGSVINNTIRYNGIQYLTGVFGAGGTQGSVQGFTNGTYVGVGGGGGNSTGGGDIYIGSHPSAGRYMMADIYEIIVYNATFSAADISKLHAYMQANYL